MARPSQVDAFLAQAAHARESLNAGLFGTVAANRRLGRGFNRHVGDTASPQVFADHPRVILHDPNEAGVLGYATNEPAPVAVASWDGEQGASAPTISRTV